MVELIGLLVVAVVLQIKVHYQVILEMVLVEHGMDLHLYLVVHMLVVGNGGHYPGYDGSAGLMNTGGGGGATDDGDDAAPQINGAGGSGIVLIAYPE